MEKAREILLALADKSRLKVINVLLRKNCDVVKISKESDLNEEETASCVLELKKSGLIEEEGKEYRITEKHIDTLSKFLGNLNLSNID